MLQVIHNGVVVSRHRKYKNAKKKLAKLPNGCSYIMAEDSPIEQRRLRAEYLSLKRVEELNAIEKKYNNAILTGNGKENMEEWKQQMSDIKNKIEEDIKAHSLENWYS